MESEAVIPTLSRRIGMLAIVDTQYIKHHYAPGLTPSTPAIVNPEHMFIAGAHLRSGAGTLEFHARVGDIVSIRCTSAAHNSNDAVILYKIQTQPAATEIVLDSFEQRIVTRRNAVAADPDSASRDGLPALETAVNFSSFSSQIRAHGTEEIRIEFALYALTQGRQTQSLVGYYCCDLNISIA
ncbi:AidA/PixA family protein [Trinickia dinghuensis]|nr:AidA/PixA family protein [Trinickia dinghuensis]